MTNVLSAHRQIWKNKKILREIYQDWYRKIVKDLTPGKTLEVGSGTGNFKDYYPDAISSDVAPQSWLDLHFDAHKFPFKPATLANIVVIDTLHHLARPAEFFREAERVLKPGGRVILLEPYPSPFSLFVYRKFHPEPFIFDRNYFSRAIRSKKDPWEANQAIPYLMLFSQARKFAEAFPTLKLIKREKLSFLVYPLSGGFENRQIIPDRLFGPVKILETLLTPLAPLLAFRCYVVIEKVA